ncbi:GIY-YIG nuclease family protein, partial [Acetobacter farinalis]
ASRSSTSKKPVCFMIHAPNQLKGNGITEQLSKPGGFSNPPGGFLRIGGWEAGQNGAIIFQGCGVVPREAGVYAYAVGHEVLYIGSAQRGVRRRLRHYESAKGLRTASRIRQALLQKLNHVPCVDIYVIVPEETLTLKGVLPIDPVSGLEDGLIRALQPTWNRCGRGR